MSKYEIAVVASVKLEDEARAAVIEKVKELVVKFGGNVTDVEDWGKKKLAYEIQKMDEAFYYFIHFESDNAECPNELEKQLRIMDGVIRYLVVREDEE
ncbi:MAG: 30S ribosomal protein S6 [Parasporobacterium sp.]|nr:30S ribosomal protein S6 [Parasporobacterium sp.]